MQLQKYLPIILLLLVSTLMEAQSRFKYQAVVRDVEGEVLAETELDIRISIHTEFGELVYSEVHANEVTSAFGVVGLNVGGGILEPGLEILDMDDIDWSSDYYSLTVDLRIEGTNDGDWQTYGTSPILSVPIAMHALSVSDKDDADADPQNEMQSLSLVDNVLSISDGNSVTLSTGGGGGIDQVLSLEGSNLSISGGNTINLAPIIESGDPTDEIQNLEINGNELSISGEGGNTIILPASGSPQNLSLVDNVLSISDGNSVTLLSGMDNPKDELQELQLNGANLELVSEDGTVNGSIPYNTGEADADADPSNELQTLSFDATTNELSLTDGNTVTIPTGGTDADADPTNEIQNLSFDATTNELSLTDGNTVTIPTGGTDADADPTNEIQSLSFDATTNELSLSDGNTVTITTGGTDADADPTNEIQDISLNAATNELSISGGSTITLPTGNGVPQDLLFNDTDFEIGLTGSATTIDLKLLPDAVDDADADPTNELQDISFDPAANELSITGGSTIVLPTTGGVPQDLLFNDTDYQLGLSGSTTTVDLSPFKPLWTEIYTLSLPPLLVEMTALDTHIGGEAGISVANLNGEKAAFFEGGEIGVHAKIDRTEVSANNLYAVQGEVIGAVQDARNTISAIQGKVTTGNVGTANGINAFAIGGDRGYGIQAGANESQHAVGGRITAQGWESTRGLEVFAGGGNDDLIGMTMQVTGAEFAIGSHYEVRAKNLIGRFGEYGGPDESFITGSQNTISGDGRLVGYQSFITGSTSDATTDELIGFNAEIGGFDMIPASQAVGAKLKVNTLGGAATGVDIDLEGDGSTGISILADSNNSYSASGVSLFLNGTGSNVSGINSNVGSNLDADIATAGNFIASNAERASYGIIARGKSIASQSFRSGTVEERSRPLTIQSAILGDESFQAASFNSSSGQTAATYDYAVLGINKTDGQSIDGDYTVGVAGFAEGALSSNYGVWGESVANTGYFNTGVFGKNLGTGTSDYAGYFVGKVRVNGNLEKAGGTFKIDHPQDPENKYLVHSFVESPDMMNIYNGNTKTDTSGKSTVELPDYFESLNIEFRYQLTVMGEFAQAIVSRKVDGNTFEIMTDKPNVEVSWQVTGVRNDPWAQKNRVVDVVDKKADRGTYLNPELYGQPQSKAYLQTDRIPSKSPKSKNSISLEESLEIIREQHKSSHEKNK